jgi:predicted DCC family thiol-disulfide oxidoreductase YuxK
MEQNQPIVFFDGVCNLCNGFVQFVLKNESNEVFKFSNLQSDFAIDFLKNNNFNTYHIDSVVVYKNNLFYIQSEAAFKIIEELKWPYKSILIFNLLPKIVNNFFYTIIAKTRYSIFGKTNTCWVMKPEYKQRFLQ